MKSTVLRFCHNILRNTSSSGYKKHWLSCGRCISHTAAKGQVLTKSLEMGNIQTDDELQESLQHEDYFNVRSLVNMRDLFNVNAHMGHHKGCRNVYMTPYLYGNRCDIDILDLEQTVPLYQDALNFTAHIAYRGGVILFVSQNKVMMPYIEKTAKACEEYAHCRPWPAGLFPTIGSKFGFQVRLPDLVIILNTLVASYEQHSAVVDSAKMLIPTIGICDSNCDPRLITYPIPASDDSFKTIPYYLNLFETAIQYGKKKRKSETSFKEMIQSQES